MKATTRDQTNPQIVCRNGIEESLVLPISSLGGAEIVERGAKARRSNPSYPPVRILATESLSE